MSNPTGDDVGMRMVIRWREPDEPGMARRCLVRRAVLWLSLRLAAVTGIAGFGFWGIVTAINPAPLPSVWYDFVPWVIAGFTGIWLLIPLEQFLKRSPRYELNARGLGENARWQSFAAFEVGPHPEYPDHPTLRLFRTSGKKSELLLPACSRRRHLIVRYVQRKLPRITDLEPSLQQRLIADPFKTPRWIQLLILTASTLWAFLVGTAWLVLHPDPIASDALPWVWIGTMFVNPVLLGIWGFGRKLDRTQRAAMMTGLYWIAMVLSFMMSMGFTTVAVLITEILSLPTP